MPSHSSVRAVVALIACVAALSCGAAARAQSTLGVAKGHVYVLDATVTPKPFHLLRFPVTAGVIGTKPDSTLDVPRAALQQFYPPSISLAVATDGSSFFYYPANKQILVYAPGASGSAKPVKTIPVPDPSPVPGPIGVDANKYIYVPTYLSPALILTPDGKIAGHISTGYVESQGNPIAFDRNGDLWLSYSYVNFLLGVYATPETNPTLLRSPCPPALFYSSLAITDDGQVLMDGGTFVVRFPTTARECPLPNVWPRELSVNLYPDVALGSNAYASPMIAVSGRDIFEVDRFKRVVEYDVEGGWDQKPIADVEWPGFTLPIEIATGP
jgi:hypothetical protein